MKFLARLVCCLILIASDGASDAWARGKVQRFTIEEATIAQIQSAIRSRRVTATEVVRLYLERIQA